MIVHFYLGSRYLQIYGTSIGQKWRIVYWFTNNLPDKDRLHKLLSTFLWKTGSSCPHLLRRRKALLKIIEDFQKKNVGGGVRF